jgi:hypothetical protein
MNVFDLDVRIIDDYARFARSFTEIRANDIREQVDAIYATGGFWPEPLISVNPHYERDTSVGSHVLFFEVITVCLVAVTMALALAHSFELPGKMRLSRDNYIATQTIYYLRWTPKVGQNLAVA